MRGTSFFALPYVSSYTSHKMGSSDDFMGNMHSSMLDRAPLYLQSAFNHNRNFFAIFSGAHDIHFFMTNHKVCMC